MPCNPYLDDLRTRLIDFTREHGVLGLFHDDRLFSEQNELEFLIAHETRRLNRSSSRSSWLRSLVRGLGFGVEVAGEAGL